MLSSINESKEDDDQDLNLDPSTLDKMLKDLE
jgi:hypothetical protein